MLTGTDRDDHVVFDHVIIAVPDIEHAADTWATRFGLPPTSGGVHPGVGTGNRIIPIHGGYVELVGVLDQGLAEQSWLGRRVLNALAAGQSLMDWMLRTADLAGFRRDLQAAGWELPEPMPGSRDVTGGGQISWSVQSLLESPGYVPGIPMVIEWGELPETHPSVAPAVEGQARLSEVALGAPGAVEQETLMELFWADPTVLIVDGAPSGLDSFTLEVADRRLTIPRDWRP